MKISYKQLYFDSCLYPPTSKSKNLNFLKSIMKKKNFYKAIINIRKYNLRNLKNEKKIIDQLSFFIPVFHIQSNIPLKKQFNVFKKEKVKLIKVHPRYLNKDLKKNFLYFKKIFQLCEKNKINIMFCTFISTEKKAVDYDYIKLITKLINITKKVRVFLMHGGGTEILRYYERFRYIKNVYLDLSYTAQHFIKTSLKQDIYFLIKNFDRRLIIGTDYPTKKILEYIDLNKHLKKKTTNYKINNIFLGNLKKIENELQKEN